MWSNTDVKPMKTFWGSDQTPEFWLTLGLKIAQKLGLWGPYCIYFWKWLQWAYKARLMWIQSNLYNKIFENLNFHWFGGPKYLHTYKSSSNDLVSQVSSDSSKIFSRKYTKTYILTYFGPIWARHFGPQRPFFTHTWKHPHYASFMVPYWKLFWENGQT